MNQKFLGDIHGDWGKLNRILSRENSNIIQVGDLGLGFNRTYEYLNQRTGLVETKVGKPDPEKFPDNFKFIRGNHDNPEACLKYPNYLGDFGIDKETGIFYLSGAWSIDFALRRSGIDWWENEQLSYIQLQAAIDLYNETKPEVVVSHTCPNEIIKFLAGSHKTYTDQKTERALGFCWESHKPKYWLFGHWHTTWRKNLLGTEFICCAINQVITLDI